MDPWPTLPDAWASDERLVASYRRQIVRASIELARSKADADPPSPPPGLEGDETEKKLHDNLAVLSMGSITRSREGAKFIETAAGAVGTVYTGILAFAFAAGDQPLPGRGLYAALFLGIAIVGAAYYLGFVQPAEQLGRVDYSISPAENVWRRTEWLGEWASRVARTRSWALRASVVALGFGVAFMPAAFLPDQLPTNPFAATAADQVDAPLPSWPAPPPNIENPDLAGLLYQAQLDEFVKSLHETGATSSEDGVNTSELLFQVFLLAIVTTVVVAGWGPVIDWIREKASQGQRRDEGEPGDHTGQV